MTRTPVTSGAIVSIGHDPLTNILECEFKGGRIYQYSGVTSAHHADLMKAESVGKHFALNFRSNPDFSATRVDVE